MAGLLQGAYDPNQPNVDPWAGVGPALAAAIPPPPPPQDAGISALIAATPMQTSDEQVRAYAKHHALSSILRVLGAGAGDAVNGTSANSDAAMADLRGRAAQPFQLAQQRARMAGLMQIYADPSTSPQMKSLILSDPESALKAIAKNQELQTLGVNQTLANANGPTMAPVPSVTPYEVEGGGILNKATGAFRGVSQPVNYPASNTAGSFTAQATGDAPQAVPASAGPPAPPIAPSADIAPVIHAADGTYAAQVLSRPRVQALSPSDQQTLLGIGYTESRLNPKVSANGSSTGAFQFQNKPGGTFYRLGGTNINDPAQQADVAASSLLENRAILQRAGIAQPTPGQLYLTHMQGPAGGPALLTAPPGTTAVNALIKAGVNPRKAILSITGNGGKPNMQASDFVSMWDRRFNANVAKAVGGAAPAQATPAAAASAQSASPPGFNVKPGKTSQDVSPQEAQSMGLAPGRWQRKPDGTLEQVSKTPDGDLKRLDSLTSTADMLRGLVNEQTQFLKHNNNFATGAPFGDAEVHVPLIGKIGNPVAGFEGSVSPDFQAMEGSHARQTFMVKPPASGRVMQSEIPYWAAQAQSPGKSGDVNVGILRDNAQRLATVTAEAKFYQDYLYEHGNSQGFERAWAKQNQAAAAGGPTPHPQGISPAEAAKLPKGTPFVTLDGRQMVRQ